MKNSITNYINKNIIKKISPVYFFSIIIIFFVTIAYNNNRYYTYLPTIPIYPNNYTEVKEVEDYINKRDPTMYEFIKNTDLKYNYEYYNFQTRLKNISDIILSIILLIITIPIFLLVIVLIKLEDGGTVFYSQERIGENALIF